MRKILLFICLIFSTSVYAELPEYVENFSQPSVQSLNRILDEIDSRVETNVFDVTETTTNNYSNITNYITGYTLDYYLKLDCSNDPLTGPLQLNSTFTIGGDASGHDVTIYGATTGYFMKWVASGGDLDVSGDISVHAGNKISLDGIDGDFYITYNSTTEYTEIWVKGALRIEM